MYGVNETMENISVFGSNLFALFFLDFYLNLFGNKLDFSLLSYIKYLSYNFFIFVNKCYTNKRLKEYVFKHIPNNLS